jgi:hypothetical protein
MPDKQTVLALAASNRPPDDFGRKLNSASPEVGKTFDTSVWWEIHIRFFLREKTLQANSA